MKKKCVLEEMQRDPGYNIYNKNDLYPFPYFFPVHVAKVTCFMEGKVWQSALVSALLRRNHKGARGDQ
jgi:hypothetical protein